tara:strand:- start:857 stop:1654 length:798 start_codon:yes stop_codon:yes gene_type:complete
MNWFSILKYKKIEPHEVVFPINYFKPLLSKLPEFMDKPSKSVLIPASVYEKISKNRRRMALQLNKSLREAAFSGGELTSKERMILKRLASTVDLKTSRIFNALAVAGSRAINQLPFNLHSSSQKYKPAQSYHAQEVTSKGIRINFVFDISPTDIKISVSQIVINKWLVHVKPLAVNMNESQTIEEFTRLYFSMFTDYSPIRIGLSIHWEGKRIHPAKLGQLMNTNWGDSSQIKNIIKSIRDNPSMVSTVRKPKHPNPFKREGDEE